MTNNKSIPTFDLFSIKCYINGMTGDILSSFDYSITFSLYDLLQYFINKHIYWSLIISY